MTILTLRLDDAIYERLRAEAFEKRTTITALIREALTAPTTEAEHLPVNWFKVGVYPSCSCGFAPANNITLVDHWAEHGAQFVDDGGRLTQINIWSPMSKHQPIESRPLNGGVQLLFRFPNGYGASLISSPTSYGNELAVARFDGDNCDDWDIDYDTPITDGVLGHLPTDEIEAALDAIAALPEYQRKVRK